MITQEKKKQEENSKMLRRILFNFTYPSRYNTLRPLLLKSLIGQINQPWEFCLPRFISTDGRTRGRKLAKIQCSLSNFVSLLVLSLRLNLWAENTMHASSAQRFIRFIVTDSLVDCFFPPPLISGSANSYVWLFSRQLLTVTQPQLLIQCISLGI